MLENNAKLCETDLNLTFQYRGTCSSVEKGFTVEIKHFIGLYSTVEL